ncbi:type II toxin-antitoxin system HicB family antitoxin [Sphingomonas nostoxanthinifaciens]|uniref:type II toxin-antitoxin system HicB family antitoxin n=1 Tax=Sphingomonas nostoxanthinifaciens TaxID=2872652 RepID=UPI001CC1E573|nr:type II toxin-antitoxin system HicB family antitoxin [Sphingomonas nostoxanthinifaciens]UAK25882.1 type II toxin-antitoxin system HicB family antitoxin [Sphingomonas nostoxanthinifaciens]
MPATYYPAIIDRSASGLGVTFPDFPGCVANGATVNEAALNAEGALALHVAAMVKDKDNLPAPSALDDIEAVDGADDVAYLLIRVDAPLKVERVLVSLDGNLLRAIDAVAPNRSAWIADAARAALARQGYGTFLGPSEKGAFGGHPMAQALEEVERGIAEVVALAMGNKQQKDIIA